jgi:cytochrome c oxidase subunit 2
MSTVAPASDYAARILGLYYEVSVWDGLILAVVVVALGLAVWRHSTRAERVPARLPVSREHLGLEVAWTLGPAVIVLAIAIPTIRATMRAIPARKPEGALTVRVLAHQWWWDITYPDRGIRTANEIHLPRGRPVWFELQSADVIHSFWVPRLGGKQDVIPGHTNVLALTPATTGVFLGQCAEFCGLSHANMRLRVVVEEAADFERWVARQQAGPAVPVPAGAGGDPVSRGARLFATGPCVTCHAVEGVSSRRVGPDLTHFASRATFAGGTLDNTAANLAAWLRDPQAEKPGAAMPPLGLDDAQVAALVSYLRSLR